MIFTVTPPHFPKRHLSAYFFLEQFAQGLYGVDARPYNSSISPRWEYWLPTVPHISSYCSVEANVQETLQLRCINVRPIDTIDSP